MSSGHSAFVHKEDILKKNIYENALDQLQALFTDDMKAVNARILEYMDSPVDLIPRIASYLISAGGKRFRPLLTLASTNIFGGDMQRAYLLAAAVEFIHTATLLHDDVVDESEERRGQESTHIIFGNQASVLVGDFLFSRAFQLMVRDGDIRILKILSEASAVIAEGEVKQLSLKGRVDIIFDQYLDVIRAKTAALFAAACEVGPVIANEDDHIIKAMRNFGLNFGIAFQMTDDALDYFGDANKLGKAVGDDFKEGKVTAPIIFALQDANEEEKVFWHGILENGGNMDDFPEAHRLLGKHDVSQKLQKQVVKYIDQARSALSQLPDRPTKKLLDQLCADLLNREY